MIYEGCTLTVWNLPSDPEVLIEHAKVCGANWVDFKAHDGDSLWTEKRYVSRDMVNALHGAGFRVSIWGYNYLDNLGPDSHPGGGGIPILEGAAAVGAIDRLRPDAYSSDIEEYADKGQPSMTSDFFYDVKNGITGTLSGDAALRGYNCPPLGAYVWCQWQQHINNALLILDAVDVVRPMCYGQDNPIERFYQSWGPILNGKSVAPVFSITDSNPDDYLAAQVAEAKQRGCIGYGIWERAAVSTRPTAVQAMSRAWHGAAQPTTPPSSDATLDELRATIFNAAGSVYNLGNQAEGTAIQEIIRLAKGEK